MPRVVDRAVEAHGVVRLAGFLHGEHRVGELDLAAGAALLGGEDVEDFRLQDVASGDVQVGRRRAPACGFSTICVMRETLALESSTPTMP